MLELMLIGTCVGGFALLCAVAVARHVRDRQPGARELAHVLGLYAGVALVAALQSLTEGRAPVSLLADMLMAAGLGVVPLLMLRFAAVFDPVPASLRRAVRWLTPVVVILGGLLDTGILPEPAVTTFLAGFLTLWLGGHLAAAGRLFIGGRRASATVIRRRSELMAAGVAGLGAVLVVAAFEGGLTGGPITITLAAAVGTLALFLCGFAPPAALRWHWERSDRGRFEGTERRLVELDDPQQLAAELLPHLLRLTGGSAAWLLDRDGRVVATSGSHAPPPQLEEVDPVTPGRVLSLRARGGAGSVLVAGTSRGCLVLTADPYALLFGARDLDGVGSLAGRLDVAVDRARLRAREVERVQELAEARRILEVDRIREDVLATVSHEVRTPLTTVCGASELLDVHWAALSEERRLELVRRIRVNGDALRGVVDEILDLTELRLVPPASITAPVLVREVIGSVVDALGEALADHEVVVDVPPGLIAAVDTSAVARILTHLLSNAAKFSPVGSRVEVVARARQRDLALRVRDEGIGMAPEDLRRVFEPFVRVGPVLRRETRGVGLGLALVSTLAETAGIRLQATSEPGCGTTITLTLPGAVNGSAAPAAARRGDREEARSSRPQQVREDDGMAAAGEPAGVAGG